MGTGVLSLDISGSPYLRPYAHCAKQKVRCFFTNTMLITQRLVPKDYNKVPFVSLELNSIVIYYVIYFYIILNHMRDIVIHHIYAINKQAKERYILKK
jgi:hypothetical protein